MQLLQKNEKLFLRKFFLATFTTNPQIQQIDKIWKQNNFS